MNERTIVIVGAGFSGTIVAAHLLRRSASTPLRVILIDRLGVVGKGVAYSTTSPGHLLNVPAGRMSAFPADEEDFLRFARERVPGATGGSFLPRLLYGEYLDVAIRSAAAQGAGEGRRFEAMHDEVVGLEEESAITTTPRTTVRLASGAKLVADRVVLALGNYPPADPPIGDRSFYASRRYIGDPWASGALQNLDAAWGVLLVGTGLTMLDVALQLSGTQARGRLVAMSRRGLVPHPHRPHGAPPSYGHLPPGLIACEPTAAAYLRAIRRHARTLEHDGVDWREIMASLRPLTPRLWETLSIAERGRFLRHARTYWDTHRHRVATDVWQRFDQLQRIGRLTVIAAKVRHYDESADAVVAHFRRRGESASETLSVGTVINCTGPEGDVRALRDPLITSLLSTGRARADALGMGLDTDSSLALVRGDGTSSRTTWLIGPLLKGRYWEATAVPELRVHAGRVARAISNSLVG